jgi:uncharacterized BrkB/YihY/UPF0761 family membrane protein
MSISTSEWGVGTTVLKAILLVVPWGVIEVSMKSHQELGFVIGMFAGLSCMYFAPPRGPALWRLLILGAVLSIVHPVVHAFFQTK